MPSPTSVHAAAIINLIALLHADGRQNCEVACSPHRWMSLFQEGTQFNQIFSWYFQMVSARVELRGIEGPPDLVIEVVSPSNRGRDLLTKRSLYARAGVREYWLVDPEARTIEILTLDRDAFHLAVAASGDETPSFPAARAAPYHRRRSLRRNR